MADSSLARLLGRSGSTPSRAPCLPRCALASPAEEGPRGTRSERPPDIDRVMLRFHAALPQGTRCQCPCDTREGSCGSEPIAVGYSSTSAPCRTMTRAASGNH
eukprot:scaffold375_cov210-Pinguiococcus_pyrenoidosus.AAC.3